MVTRAKSAARLQLATSNQDDIRLAYLVDGSEAPKQKFKSVFDTLDGSETLEPKFKLVFDTLSSQLQLVTHDPDDIHLVFLVDGSEALEPEPKSVSDALSNNNWKAAMQSEFDALMQNNTWTLVPI